MRLQFGPAKRRKLCTLPKARVGHLVPFQPPALLQAQGGGKHCAEGSVTRGKFSKSLEDGHSVSSRLTVWRVEC